MKITSYVSAYSVEGFQLLHMIKNTWYVDLFDNSLIVHMSWCLILLEVTSLMTVDTEHRRQSDWISKSNFEKKTKKKVGGITLPNFKIYSIPAARKSV